MDGAPVGCRSGEQQCRIVVSLQGPDPYGFGLDPFEVPEIVEEVGTAIGYRPAQGILVIAMCNQRIDHCLIARLALHLAQQFDAYIDMGGTLTPPLPPAVKKEDGTYVPWFDLVTLDDIRTFLADLPGRVWEISGEDDVRRAGLLAVARRRRHLPRRLGAPSAFPYDQVNGSSMPMSEDFHQLALRFRDPIQHDYEVIRPVMLADEPIAVRSRETGIDRTTVSEKAKRFLQRGMLGLVDQRTTTAKGRQEYPDVVAGYILYLKQLYPPIHDHEIVRIIARKYGYTTNHVTVRRFLDRHPIPVQLPLPLMGFHQFEDAYRARWTVVRLFYEGWHKTSIAGCLGLSRKHVWHILKAFERDGFAGLEDQRTQRHPPPATQLTLPFLKEVLAVQREYPRAGRFRVRGLIEQRTGQAPSERTVGRAMAINRQAHGAPPAWSTDRPDVPTADGVLKEMPYDPAWRHRYWFIDYRYLVRLDDDDHWAYSLCIIEGYSRKILAGMATEYQDTIAVLQLLSAALSEYGRPEGIVSDNGSVFTAAAYEELLDALEIEVCHIEKGKPWENLIEAQFKVQVRLAEVAFQRAADFHEIQDRHAAFVETFNTTPHWAHRERDDGLRSPVEVLSWARGQAVVPADLQQALRHLQVERVVNQRGYVSVQRFYIYAERGLARTRVSVWLYDGRLHVVHREVLLARYAYRYNRKERRLLAVGEPQLYQTAYASPQFELWELDDEQWRKVTRRPYDRHYYPPDTGARQLALPVLGVIGLVVWRTLA